MVKLYVGITDFDWFQFLSALPGVEEVNFGSRADGPISGH
jgi:hypothetical protein